LHERTDTGWLNNVKGCQSSGREAADHESRSEKRQAFEGREKGKKNEVA
jgi:hypothetical protein